MKMSKECQNCGTILSNDFARVYGDNNNEVQHCFNCMEEEGKEYVYRGAGAKEDLTRIKRTKGPLK